MAAIQSGRIWFNLATKLFWSMQELKTPTISSWRHTFLFEPPDKLLVDPWWRYRKIWHLQWELKMFGKYARTIGFFINWELWPNGLGKYLAGSGEWLVMGGLCKNLEGLQCLTIVLRSTIWSIKFEAFTSKYVSGFNWTKPAPVLLNFPSVELS